jgi:hypothetical protein
MGTCAGGAGDAWPVAVYRSRGTSAAVSSKSVSGRCRPSRGRRDPSSRWGELSLTFSPAVLVAD